MSPHINVYSFFLPAHGAFPVGNFYFANMLVIIRAIPIKAQPNAKSIRFGTIVSETTNIPMNTNAKPINIIKPRRNSLNFVILLVLLSVFNAFRIPPLMAFDEVFVVV